MAYFEFEPAQRLRSSWEPLIDVYESPSEIVVRVELPGVQKKDIRLRWKDRLLTISGIKERGLQSRGSGQFLCVERQYGTFRRDIAIGTPIDFRKSSAEFRHGLLKIRLPKTAENGEAFIPIDEST